MSTCARRRHGRGEGWDDAGVAVGMTATLPAKAVEWGRVRRVRFDVRHHYRYTYREPISRLEQRLIMTPPDYHVDQALLKHELHVTGASGKHVVAWEWDRFGNRVARVNVPSVREAVTFEAVYRVERAAAFGMGEGPRASEGWDVFRTSTALTAPDERLEAVASAVRRDGDGDDASLAERAHAWASRAISYQVGVTGVRTPAAMALHLGSGVCQDYAHIMLAVLRLLDVPARYVSGHLLGEGVPHAWVEVLARGGSAAGTSPDRVIAFDPTNKRRAGMQYVTVAVGRDFADVSPTSGRFTGAPTGTMTWGKQALVVEAEYQG